MKATLPFALAACVVLAGCGTTPVATADATAPPDSRILSRAYASAAADRGVVIVKRDSGIAGVACSARVFVNAQPIADLRTSEKITLYLPAGDYIIGGEPQGICQGSLSEVRIAAKPGTLQTLRMGMSASGQFTLQPTAF